MKVGANHIKQRLREDFDKFADIPFSLPQDRLMILTALLQLAALVLILISASVNRAGWETPVKLTLTNAHLHRVSSHLSAMICSMDLSAHARCPTQCVQGSIGGKSSSSYYLIQLCFSFVSI